MGTGMVSASGCARELLERIAAGVGVDAGVELEEDAEASAPSASARTWGWSSTPWRAAKHTLLLGAGRHGPAAWTPSRAAAATRLLLGEALHEYAPTRMRLSPGAKDQARHHCPFHET
jgi:hypothetical protein